MINSKKPFLDNVKNWSSGENKLLLLGSFIFYLLFIMFFFIELIYFENSLGFERGFEGMGGINFLKIDSFFLIFTMSVIFMEYFVYIAYYTRKGPASRIFKEKTIGELIERCKKSGIRQMRIYQFFILMWIIFIFDGLIRIFLGIANQLIIIELFLNFIFCFILGSLYFPLIMLTMDTYIINDSKYKEFGIDIKEVKHKSINEIFRKIFLTLLISISVNLLILVKIIIFI